jgi:hypothetical protein
MGNPSHYLQTLSPAPTPPYHHVVPVDPCPLDPEDSAERYCLNRMPLDEATKFAEHFAACPRCAAILDREIAVMFLVRAAGQPQ